MCYILVFFEQLYLADTPRPRDAHASKNMQKSEIEKDDTMIPMMLSYFKVSLK